MVAFVPGQGGCELMAVSTLNRKAQGFSSNYSVGRESITTQTSEYSVKTLLYTMGDKNLGTITIPGLQRHYVWTKKRASLLVESIINKIPVPQIFLYAKDDKLIVIDGLQRLMTMYYFYKKRFPKTAFRTQQKYYNLNELPLDDPRYFGNFKLSLPDNVGKSTNKLNGKSYDELERDDLIRFNRYPVQSVIITPSSNIGGDESVIYEIFSRLNSGTSLNPQEIRRCAYDSKFFETLYDMNTNAKWQKMYGQNNPDKKTKGEESLLRGFALMDGGYKAPTPKFLNAYCFKAKKFDDQRILEIKKIFESFLEKNGNLHLRHGNNRFSQPLFDAVFVTACRDAYQNNGTDVLVIDPDKLKTLKERKEFGTSTQDVTKRLRLAGKILRGDIE